ncbi:MAG: FlgD immunoglobulin-like domain containing protein [Calditrichia bacterium]
MKILKITAICFLSLSFVLSAQPGTLLKTLPSPTNQLSDLTWDGSYLYLLGLSNHVIYQIDTTDGSVVNTINTGISGALGLTYKDGYFWLSVISDNSLKKIDQNGSVIKSVAIPANQNIGIEWDGTYFRIADSGSPDEKILTVDSLGNLVGSFLFPGDSPFGLTWDGNTIWCADNHMSGVAMIYQFEPSTGTVITSFPCPNGGGAANGLAWDGEHLWIADQSNDLIYKVTGNVVTGIANSAVLTQSFHLYQNYPNPFNPVTVISYQLTGSSDVELTIYDILGQPVKNLVKGKQPAGYYDAEWNGKDNAGKDVSSGIYIYRIKAGKYTATRKMILLR